MFAGPNAESYGPSLSLPLSFHSCLSSLCTGGSHGIDAFQLAACKKQVQSKQAAGCWWGDGSGERQTRLEIQFHFRKVHFSVRV